MRNCHREKTLRVKAYTFLGVRFQKDFRKGQTLIDLSDVASSYRASVLKYMKSQRKDICYFCAEDLLLLKV